MTSTVTTLRELEIGKTATVVSVGGEGALRQHFLDMGIKVCIPADETEILVFLIFSCYVNTKLYM